MNHEDSDIVDRALAALLASAHTDSPPSGVVQQVRRQFPQPLRIPWLSIAACVACFATATGLTGCHQHLFARVAGRQLSPRGTTLIFYTDGTTSTQTSKESP